MAILLFIFAIALQKSLCNDLRRHRKTKGQRYGIGRGKARYNHGIHNNGPDGHCLFLEKSGTTSFTY